MTLDAMKNFRVRRNSGMRQVGQSHQHDIALMQVAQSEFADDKGMRQNHSCFEQRDEGLVARPQMIDPDGRIG